MIGQKTDPLLTAEEFMRLPSSKDGTKRELVRGIVVTMSAPGFLHGEVQLNIGLILKAFVKSNKLGRVTVESGLRTHYTPDSVRGPDVAFWSVSQVPLDAQLQGLPDGPAELCVEVLSPSNTTREMKDKIREYCFAGVKMVWVVDPVGHTVTVYRKPGNGLTLWEDGELSGEDVIPGFTCLVSDFFDV